MSGRSGRFIAILILLILVGTLGWACSSSQTSTTSSSAAITTITTPAAGGSATGTSDLLHTQLKTTSDTPSEYVDAVKQGRPVVILFYVPGGVDDVRVLDSLTKLQSSFTQYAFLLYDYKTPDAYGDLSTLLQVQYPPEVVLVDGTGTIQQIWNGYVDEGSLNQSLVNLGQM